MDFIKKALNTCVDILTQPLLTSTQLKSSLAGVTERDSTYVDGEKYYVMARIREDSIGTYERVQEASSDIEYVLQKKKIKYQHETEDYYREISHPNILQLVAVDKRGGNIRLVYSEMNNRNLESYLQSENINSLDKVKQVFSIFRGVCDAIKYLSDMNRVYTALCTENIILTTNNKPLLRGITYIEPGTRSELVDQVRNLGHLLENISDKISWDDWKLEQYVYLRDEINTKVCEFTNASENGLFVHDIIQFVSELDAKVCMVTDQVDSEINTINCLGLNYVDISDEFFTEDGAALS